MQAILLLPIIAAGFIGSPITVTVSVFGAPIPQPLIALTAIVPEFVPGVTVMVLVVLFPVHPLGNVHTYLVAPATADAV